MKKLFFVSFMFVLALFGAVDINSATKEELSSIKGVGEKKADAIIEYRTTKCFESVGELEKVKGFGAKSVEKLGSEVVANPCKK